MTPEQIQIGPDECMCCDERKPVVVRGTLFPGAIPYRLCKECADWYCALDDEESKRFRDALYLRASVEGAEPLGSA